MTGNKYSETGSNPFYLNFNNTAKDFSLHETSNPEYGLLDTLTKFILVEENMEVEQPVILDDTIIEGAISSQE